MRLIDYITFRVNSPVNGNSLWLPIENSMFTASFQDNCLVKLEIQRRYIQRRYNQISL